MKFTILMSPVAKARARTVIKGGRVMTFTPSKTVRAENMIRTEITKSNVFYPAGIPLLMTVIFVVEKPKSANKKRLYPVTRPDLDNLTKTVLDGCNKYLYADDSQIVSLYTSKEYGSPPRVEIFIEEYKG